MEKYVFILIKIFFIKLILLSKRIEIALKRRVRKDGRAA